MDITIKYRAQLAALIKFDSETMEANNVKDVLQHIKKRFGAEAEKIAKKMLIVVNGQSILLLKHYKTELKDNDVVSFLPICGGG